MIDARLPRDKEKTEPAGGRVNPVRFLEAFGARLDLRAAGFRFPEQDLPKAAGGPGSHLPTLFKLYRYGDLRQLRFSRRLEAECALNLEWIWLLRQWQPDFKILTGFRKDKPRRSRPWCANSAG
jgi:transposase